MFKKFMNCDGKLKVTMEVGEQEKEEEKEEGGGELEKGWKDWWRGGVS